MKRFLVDWPFDAKFWSFVRSILSKARPVGFEEIDDPEGTLPKGPEDSNGFIQKVMGISAINPIHPILLAEASNIPLHIVLTELFYATKTGLVYMKWAPDCVRCGSQVCAEEQLSALPARANCAGCRMENEISCLDKIKVIFMFNHDVLYLLADNFACQPSKASMAENATFCVVPATSTGSGFRYSAGCGPQELMIRPSLKPGRYRMHCPVALTDCNLVVQREASEIEMPIQLKVKVSSIRMDPSDPNANRRTITIPHGKVHFDILPDTKSFFVLWVQNDKDEETLLRLPDDERQPYTSASEAMHHPVFHHLFSDQIVGRSSTLELQRVILVFTDIVGSTDLYASLGDGAALRLVKKHFEVLFDALSKGGRVVKTIGDAIMASFTCGRTAILAVAQALRNVAKYCRRTDGMPLEIRVGIHAGSTVVVPLNGINDYFGQTVNLAARVEAAARSSEVLVTEAFLSGDLEAQKAFEDVLVRGEGFVESFNDKLRLKGISGAVRARGCRYVGTNIADELCEDYTSLHPTKLKRPDSIPAVECVEMR